MTNCPVCNKVVDPLRARSVGVRAGKVVAYCSSECAAAAETQPVRVPVVSEAAAAAPATGSTSGVFTSAAPQPAPVPPRMKTPVPKRTLEDYDSGPVIEILHEPASGVVTSARDPRPDPSEPAIEPEKSVDKPTKQDKKAEKALAKAEKRALKSDKVAAVSKPKTSEDSVTASGERDSSPRTATATETADPASVLANVDVVEAPGVRTQRRRRDSLDSKAAWDWLDDEPAEPVGRRRRKDAVDTNVRSKSGGFFIGILVLALVGAGG
ncbi:MAG TPA: hypothetical protein VIU61_12140, partial [Kofleriaceae bacterium]